MVGEGEEVRELGEGGFSGEIETEDDTGAAELSARSVDGGDEAVDALADVDDDDASGDGGFDDLGETAVRAAGDIAHAEGFEDEAAQVGEVEDRVDHFGLDTGEDTETGYVGSVETLVDGERGDGGWS